MAHNTTSCKCCQIQLEEIRKLNLQIGALKDSKTLLMDKVEELNRLLREVWELIDSQPDEEKIGPEKFLTAHLEWSNKYHALKKAHGFAERPVCAHPKLEGFTSKTNVCPDCGIVLKRVEPPQKKVKICAECRKPLGTTLGCICQLDV